MNFGKLIVATLTVFVGVSLAGIQPATAQDAPYGMAGCGLGSMLLGSGGGMMQIFAATTNGTSASQTFGITFGTSNCVERGVVTQDQEQEAFFEVNHNSIRAEMAAGQGEHLAAVGSLLGCSTDVQDELASFSQSNYEKVFPTEETTATQALYSYKMQLSQQDQFANTCTRL